MIELAVKEVQIVKEKYKSYCKDSTLIQDELVDHYCMMIESRMMDDVSFEVALVEAFEKFDKSTILEIEEEINQINKSYKINQMLKFSFLFIAIAILFNPFSSNTPLSHDPPSIFPMGKNYKITSNFGARINPLNKSEVFHKGIDIKAPLGTDVLATSDGVAEEVVIGHRKRGNYIVIAHDETYKTTYSHLGDVTIKEGDIIKKGAIIAKVGTTGLSTGPHLHYEVIKNGKNVDPIDYILIKE